MCAHVCCMLYAKAIRKQPVGIPRFQDVWFYGDLALYYEYDLKYVCLPGKNMISKDRKNEEKDSIHIIYVHRYLMVKDQSTTNY